MKATPEIIRGPDAEPKQVTLADKNETIDRENL